jgi:hypothetical protein
MSSIRTYTGQTIDLLDPHKENIHIVDICHGLQKNRFNGHCQCPWSVLSHTVIGTLQIVEPLNLLSWNALREQEANPERYTQQLLTAARWFFIHDMAEALSLIHI